MAIGSKHRIGALALTLTLFAGAAVSHPLTSTYNGSIISGVDGAGLFGSAGADLAGASITATFQWDTSLGAPGSEGYYGGSGRGLASPLLFVNITVDGQTYVDDDVGYSEAIADVIERDRSHNPIAIVSDSYGDGTNSSVFAGFYSRVPPATFSYVPGGQFAGSGPCLNDPCGWFTLPGGTNGKFTLSSFSVDGLIPPAPEPEPMTWALMSLGFGAVGAALRSRPAFA